MKINTQTIILFGLGLIAGLLIYNFTQSAEAPTITGETDKEEIATTTSATSTDGTKEVTLPDGTVIGGVPEGSNVVILPNETGPFAPNPKKTINIATFFEGEAYDLILKKITDAQNKVQQDPNDPIAWVELAGLYVTAQDWDGAREIYEYLSEVSPGNATVAVNLGSLYHLHLQDYVKAERNYRRALVLDHTNETAYEGLHQMYLDAYLTNTNLAEKILLEGLAVNSQSINLNTLLAKYYKNKGNIIGAKQYYTNARKIAERLGDNNLASILDNEIENLEN